VQVILPGEVARAHRHTPTAIRFIMQGEGAYTDVDGERIPMSPGDLVLTPSWAWHDHGNAGEEPVVWLDGLDIPLIQSLEAMFFQMYETPQVPLTNAEHTSRRRHGQAHVSPTWIREKTASSPLLVYSWTDTLRALQELRDEDGDPFDGVALEYTHPQTGGPVLPTMACWIQLLGPGRHLKAHRHTGSAVYYAAQGQGTTVIDGQAFEWKKGDVIALPPWFLHEHANTSQTEDAILFSIQDRPVLEALNLYREEAG
jgi:gentisate 1,2-dioxygenase